MRRVINPRRGAWVRSFSVCCLAGALVLIVGMFFPCVVESAGNPMGHAASRCTDCDAAAQVEERAPMPAAIAAHSACLSGEDIFVVGGGDSTSTHFWRYDTRPDRWDTLPDALRPRAFAVATAYDGKVFVIGGFRSPQPGQEECPSEVDCFDIEKQQWSVVGSMPAPRSRMAAVRLGDEFWLIGGYSRDVGNHKRVDVFNLKTRRWRRAPDLSAAIHGAAAGVDEQGILVLGNQQRGERAWLLPREAKAWQSIDNAPEPRLFASAITTPDKVIFIGNRAYGDIPLLAWEDGAWHESSNVFINTHRAAAVLAGDWIYCLGGETEDGQTDAVQRFRIKEIQWR